MTTIKKFAVTFIPMPMPKTVCVIVLFKTLTGKTMKFVELHFGRG